MAGVTVVGFTKPSRRLLAGIFAGVFIGACYLIITGNSRKDVPLDYSKDQGMFVSKYLY